MEADFYEKALDSSFDGVLIADRQGVVIYINAQYEKITGLQRQKMLGARLSDLLEQGIINTSISLDVLKTGKTVSAVHQYASGKSALSSAKPVFDENGSIIAVFNNTRNIDDLITLQNELKEHRLLQRKNAQEIGHLRSILSQKSCFVYTSRCMQEVLSFADKVAPFDTTVAIFGESGTGKEVLSRYLHKRSARADSAFVKVNCAAIPKELFESELFGYEKGAFTGASEKGKIGLFELAHGGTLFLDEIGELQLDVQSKVLRAIQEKEILRIGGKNAVQLDIRLLVATNRNLEEEVRKGTFREDLYFRLNIFPIVIPPLRERPEDIVVLVRHFMEKLNHKYKSDKRITQEAVDVLARHAFPGNVRELENSIEYLFIMCEQDIQIDMIPAKILSAVMLSGTDKDTEKRGKEQLPYLIEMFEKSIIEDVTGRFRTLEEASRVLGIHYSTLSRKMQKYRLKFA